MFRHDFLLRGNFQIWDFTTVPVDSVCMISTFPYMQVISISGISLCNSKIYCLQIHFVIFYCSSRDISGWHPLCYKQSRDSRRKFQTSLFSSANTYEKNTLFVKTTALLTFVIARVDFFKAR